MRIFQHNQVTTLEAAADLSTHPHKLVMVVPAVAGGQQARVNVASAGARSIGILQNKPTVAGQGAVVVLSGRAKLVVNGTAVPIVAGDMLKAAAAGVGVKAATAADKVGALALESSSVDGDIIEVLIMNLDRS